MFDSVFKDIRYELIRGNNVKKLILITIIVFCLQILGQVITTALSAGDQASFHFILRYLELPVSFRELAFQPWSIFTYGFINFGFWQIIFLMIALYWFGNICGDLLGDKRFLRLFIFCMLAGAFITLVTINILPINFDMSGRINGSWAGVYGLMMAAGLLAPDYNLRIILIGRVRLKYVVLVVLLFSVIITLVNFRDVNAYAHLGGMLAGYLYVTLLRKGWMPDWPIVLQHSSSRFKTKEKKSSTRIVNLFSLIKKNELKQRRNPGNDDEEKLDGLLIKIKNNGRDSLTGEELDFLENYGKD
ncbi:MAG TPA: rhomboid family intramembrane serine protease [Saprospiraceae bacterium]|nr:rhomboid family intramembrane serine protease [Saprospiraceae bacterium]HQW55075.1 rhomboid family intramembrane serine protease [Saprospiraceae bacterium]